MWSILSTEEFVLLVLYQLALSTIQGSLPSHGGGGGGGGGLGRAVPRCRHIGCVVSHGAAAVSCCVVLCYVVLWCVGFFLFDFCSLDHMMIMIMMIMFVICLSSFVSRFN